MKTRPLLLLVDDDLGPMKYVLMALTQAGYDVTQICSVAEAIGFLRKYSQTIDGVILDVMLPNGQRDADEHEEGCQAGGLTVFKYLQANHPGIPILILSNVSSEMQLGEFTTSEHVRVEWKADHTPFKIAHIMKDLLASR